MSSSGSEFLIKLLAFGILFSTSWFLLTKFLIFTKLIMFGILFSTTCLLLSFLSKTVLSNVTKFWKFIWNCFQCVHITFQKCLVSTFSKWRCINTSCSFNLWFNCVTVTPSSTFTFVQADFYGFWKYKHIIIINLKLHLVCQSDHFRNYHILSI